MTLLVFLIGGAVMTVGTVCTIIVLVVRARRAGQIREVIDPNGESDTSAGGAGL